MIVGIPREAKEEEDRVAITPTGVSAFVTHGHRVLIEKGAGLGSGILDHAYEASGATVLESAAEIWQQAQLLMKVKEPQSEELRFLRSDLVLFAYLHLAANEELTRLLCREKVASVAYETIQLEDGSLPLLMPMSEIAGRLALQVGAWCLQAENGGRGVLLGGASGVRPGKAVILGAGIAGSTAAHVATGMGADVSILDVSPSKLRYIHDILGGRLTTLMSNRANVEEEVVAADLVIGSVLIPGAKAPKLVPRSLVKLMKPGTAIVDISIDQGGCAETSRPTTHLQPIYIEEGVVHYCVTNMPAIVPYTSTYALTNATLSYGLEIADKGLRRSMRENPSLAKGLNTYKGRITHSGVAAAFGLDQTPVDEVFKR